MDRMLRELKDKVSTLEMSNSLMEKELERMRSERMMLLDEIDARDGEIMYLRSRSLWRRLFNI